MAKAKVTDAQWQEFFELFSDAVVRALDDDDLNEEQVQAFLDEEGNHHALEEYVVKLIRDRVRKAKYADEEVDAEEYVYPKKFGKASKPILEQVGILQLYFPDLVSYPGYSNKLHVPHDADGLYVIPDWRRLAPTYAEACAVVIAHLKKAWRFRDYLGLHDFSTSYQRRVARTEEMLGEIRMAQHACDLFIIPAQFGIAHRGRSPRRVTEILKRTEFHLGIFEVGCMLLTHPERLPHDRAHWIGCGGDEMTMLSPETPTGEILAFAFLDGLLGPVMAYVGCGRPQFGCATGFVPQLM